MQGRSKDEITLSSFVDPKRIFSLFELYPLSVALTYFRNSPVWLAVGELQLAASCEDQIIYNNCKPSGDRIPSVLRLEGTGVLVDYSRR